MISAVGVLEIVSGSSGVLVLKSGTMPTVVSGWALMVASDGWLWPFAVSVMTAR